MLACLSVSMAKSQLEHESLGFREQLKSFIRALPPYRILDSGRLVVSHAGLPERFHGEESDRARVAGFSGAVEVVHPRVASVPHPRQWPSSGVSCWLA